MHFGEIEQIAVTSFHAACLDVWTGEGLLVLPNPDHDARIGVDSVHEAAFAEAMRRLDALGWEPSCDEAGQPIIEAETEDGRPVMGLYCREPIQSMPDLEALAAAQVALREWVGI